MTSWKEYQEQAGEYDAQSLGGYGQFVYEACRAQCAYCGLSPQSAAEPEVMFDIWRQFSVEHIVPSSRWPPRDVLASAVQGWAAPSEWEEIQIRVHDMNKVAACHFCNSVTGRYPKKGKEQAVKDFWRRLLGYVPPVTPGPRGKFKVDWTKPASLSEARGDRTQSADLWLSELKESIMRVWLDKSKQARETTCALHKQYRLFFAPQIGLPIPQPTRVADEPDVLDGKVKAIIDGEGVYRCRRKAQPLNL